ncbi:hypothetical protein LINPERPRIM_LOCUS33637, partial [Linum perenne]
TRAELRAATIGLQLVWEAGFRFVELQCDSKVAVLILLREGTITHQHTTEVLLFRRLL